MRAAGQDAPVLTAEMLEHADKIEEVLGRYPAPYARDDTVLTDQQGEFLLELERRRVGIKARHSAFKEIWKDTRNIQGKTLGRDGLNAAFKRWKESKQGPETVEEGL